MQIVTFVIWKMFFQFVSKDINLLALLGQTDA